MQKVKNANKVYLIIISFIVMACATYDHEPLLIDVYLEDLNEKGFSVKYIDWNNSNDLVIKRISAEDLDIYNNQIIKEHFSKNELNNLKTQTTKNTHWNQNVLISDKYNFKHEGERLHISKPVYSTNMRFSLIYSYEIGKNEIYFQPSIEIYKFENKKWHKVAVLPPRTFTKK